MGRGSIIIVEIVNFMFLILGIIVMCNSIYRHAAGSSYCQRMAQRPAIIVGLVIILVSFMGLMGACFEDNSLLLIYLFFVLVIIVGVMAFTVFGLVASAKGRSVGVGNLEEQYYKLEDFSNWLQEVVKNGQNWDRVKACLIDDQICRNVTHVVNHDGSTSGLLFDRSMKLSPLEWGCCRPPRSCNFSNVSATSGRVPNGSGGECRKWKNEEDSLCYDCDSCKVGFLTNLRNQLRVMIVYSVLSVCFLVFIYFTGCCARRSIKYRYVPYSPYVQP